MPNFTSLEMLEQWLKSSGWMQAKTSSGLTMKDILIQEGEKLKSCLQRAIEEYYDSYQPSGIVPRTDNLKNSLQVDKFVKINTSTNTLSIEVNFDEAMIAAESVFGSDSSAYNTAVLINDGWEVQKDVSFKGVEHFGIYKPGFDFVGKALQYFYADNPYNLKVRVEGFPTQYD